ncbi:MAG: hypothetical protein ABJO30_01080 [Hyphomicrobiales bacterium]
MRKSYVEERRSFIKLGAEHALKKYPNNVEWEHYAKGIDLLWDEPFQIENIDKAIAQFKKCDLPHAAFGIFDCYEILDDKENSLKYLEKFRRYDKKCEASYCLHYALEFLTDDDADKLVLLKKSAKLGNYYSKKILVMRYNLNFKRLRVLKNGIFLAYLLATNPLDVRLF